MVSKDSMRYLIVLFIAFFISYLEAQTLSDYRLASGDVLSIVVFNEEDLSFDEVAISDAGTIIYPFLGEVTLGGLSIGEASDFITAQLADGWLISPSVNIRIIRYRQSYIHGEVSEPGGYDYQPGLTLQQAVALAGGFTARASGSRFFIQSEESSSGTGVRADLDSGVQPGDTIIIQESFF